MYDDDALTEAELFFRKNGSDELLFRCSARAVAGAVLEPVARNVKHQLSVAASTGSKFVKVSKKLNWGLVNIFLKVFRRQK